VTGRIRDDLRRRLQELREQGLYKEERVITGPQGAEIAVAPASGGDEDARAPGESRTVLNFCSNNYLGLAGHPEVVRAAQEAMDRWGYGLSSVRFICGTQAIHRELERRVSAFLGTEDTLLYAACFDANGGLFEPLLGEEDAVISDELNHASIIDGVRLCKAARLRYRHADMADLERCLREAAGSRYRLVCTDGIFSMDGDIANLADICGLAERHDALVMVDDSHATGYIGPRGRGTPELCGVEGRVDLVTTTFGKALGGAGGGCASGRAELIAFLRQRSRPYLFSNTLAPATVGATLKVLEILERTSDPGRGILESAAWFRGRMTGAGFELVAGATAIVPVMLYEEPLAVKMADRLLEEGIYVIGFAYPVVPRGKARIRVQISAAHSRAHLERAVDAFTRVGRELGVIR
jgi:glycine C-acetyltransferase